MKFNHHKYIYTNPFGNPRHHWEVAGPQIAAHFHVNIVKDYPPSCGLELHYRNPPEYMKDYAPSHLDCKLTGGACWHDGTSLYAVETLWPRVELYLEGGDHESVFRMLEDEIDSRTQDFKGGEQ